MKSVIVLDTDNDPFQSLQLINDVLPDVDAHDDGRKRLGGGIFRGAGRVFEDLVHLLSGILPSFGVIPADRDGWHCLRLFLERWCEVMVVEVCRRWSVGRFEPAGEGEAVLYSF